MSVAPELAQDRLRVPELEVWIGRGWPVEVRMACGERAAFYVARRLLGGDAGQRGGAGHVRRCDDVITQDAPAGRVDRGEACGDQISRSSPLPRVRDGGADELRVEIEEGGDHHVRADCAHRRRTRCEVARGARDAQASVRLRGLGNEVDHPVQRLDRPPRLSREKRCCALGRRPVAGHRVSSCASCSARAAVAATTGRLLDASRTIRSFPSRSTATTPASRPTRSPAR